MVKYADRVAPFFFNDGPCQMRPRMQRSGELAFPRKLYQLSGLFQFTFITEKSHAWGSSFLIGGTRRYAVLSEREFLVKIQQTRNIEPERAKFTVQAKFNALGKAEDDHHADQRPEIDLAEA